MTDRLVPVWARVSVVTITLLVLANAGTAEAALGGTAVPGDNCTPFNTFQIGAPRPGSPIGPGTIVNQVVILSKGWLVVGWILSSRDGSLALVPYRLNGSEAMLSPPGVPYVFSLSSSSSDVVRAAYRAAREQASQLAPRYAQTEFVDDLSQFIIAPCFSSGLPL